MKKFLIDALEAFAIAAIVVLLEDGEKLVAQVGSREQLYVAIAAVGRAAVAAGCRAALPIAVAYKAKREGA